MITIRLLESVRDFLEKLPAEERGRIAENVQNLQDDDFRLVTIKTLHGPIKEVIIRQYRLVFFRKSEVIYIVEGFKKQSRKTPLRVIERAEKIYKLLP